MFDHEFVQALFEFEQARPQFAPFSALPPQSHFPIICLPPGSGGLLTWQGDASPCTP